MKLINIAYEILHDPRKKRLSDVGHDPDDPMAGQGDINFADFNPFEMFFGQGGN
jgi:DnaJ-class molecular chaperone